MKLIIENTDQITTLIVDGAELPARVWVGATESGIPVQCLIPDIVPVVKKDDPRFAEVTAQFGKELQEHQGPRPLIAVYQARMVL